MINIEWLKGKSACSEGLEWFEKKYGKDSVAGNLLVKVLIKEKKLQWANWLIVRLMDKIQCVKYAVFAAEQVISIFEKKYPDDKRPRQAIEAAKAYIKDSSEVNRVAAHAAADAAYAAAHAAHAADAAYAAHAAAHAAHAADAAAHAAHAADAAYAAADAAAYVLRVKILKNGLKILRTK